MNVIATVNKMNDLEEEYRENLEKEGELFLEGLKNKRSLGELEKEYSKKVREIRRIYEKSLKKELEKEKNSQIKGVKKNINIQEKKEKPFQVESIELNKNWKERKQIEVASSSYKTKRKIKDFIQKALPNYLLYSYYRIKRILKDFFKEVGKKITKIWNNSSEKALNVLSLIKKGFLKIISIMKRLWVFIRKKIKKDKGDKKEEDKVSGGKKESAEKSKSGK